MVKPALFRFTHAAVCIALLLTAQLLSGPLGQLATGSLVNLLLIVSVLTGGWFSGVAVAALSPVGAFLLGVGPALPPLLPFVILGNLTIVSVWQVFARLQKGGRLRWGLALAAGAAAKTLVLYAGVVCLAVPLLRLPDKQAAVISASFSLPQLFTALIGGGLALLILPVIRKARRLWQVPAA